MLPADSDNTSLQSRTSSFPRKCLAVTLERDLLVALPGTALGGTRLVVVVSLALKAAVLAPSGGEAAHLAVFLWKRNKFDGIAG